MPFIDCPDIFPAHAFLFFPLERILSVPVKGGCRQHGFNGAKQRLVVDSLHVKRVSRKNSFGVLQRTENMEIYMHTCICHVSDQRGCQRLEALRRTIVQSRITR